MALKCVGSISQERREISAQNQSLEIRFRYWKDLPSRFLSEASSRAILARNASTSDTSLLTSGR
jgi:hypothetical protein